MPPPPRDLDRFLTFLDAVVAIAVTLLVLPLVDLAGQVHEGQPPLGRLLRDHVPDVTTFLLSFVVIARLWRVHHRLFERAASYDQLLVTASLAWALTIVLLPFPTALTAEYRGSRLAVGAYIAVIAASSACLSACAVRIHRRPGLRRPGVDGAESSPLPSLLVTGLLLGALVVAVALPVVGYWSLLLLLLEGPALRVLRRRTTRRAL